MLEPRNEREGTGSRRSWSLFFVHLAAFPRVQTRRGEHAKEVFPMRVAFQRQFFFNLSSSFEFMK